MKKIIFLLMLFASILAFGQNQTGKWLLTADGYLHKYEVTFSSGFPSLVQTSITTQPSVTDNPVAFGGYSNNFSLNFFIFGEEIFQNNSTTGSQWFGWPGESTFQPRFRIVPLPGNSYKAMTFYNSQQMIGSTPQEHYNMFNYDIIEKVGTNWQRTGTTQLMLSYFDNNGAAGSYTPAIQFTITPEEGNTRKVIACGNMSKCPATGNNQLDAGIYQWNIQTTGIDPAAYSVLIDENYTGFDANDFFCWDITSKNFSSANGVVAWLNPNPIEGNPNSKCQNLYILKTVNGATSQATKYDLGKGRLSGIAFSDYDQNLIYVSAYKASTNTSGIYAVNYNTGAIVGIIATGDYGRTNLRKAPDGHIYAMSNDGMNMGQINQTTGQFQSNVLSLPAGSTLGTYRMIDGLQYYILPEEDRTYTQPALTLNAIGAGLCQTNGSITATVTGGIPPYTFTWEVRTGSTWTLVSTYTGTSTTNTLNGVEAGEMYQCTVTDQAGTVVPQTITVPYTSEVTTGLNTWSGPTTNQTRYFSDGFYVPAGQTITLTNCTCYFGNDAKVEVRNGIIDNTTTITTSGGKLVLNNTTFTVAPGCDMWKGVEVWGHKTFNQYNPNGKCAQGHIVLTNSSEISYAEVGVLLTSRGITTTFDPNKTGGIIQAENNANPNAPHRFRNNRYSVLFWTYHNMLQGSENDNRSYLKNCLFDVNPSYLIGNSWTEAHVYMFDVKGITLSGNTFSYSLTGNPSGHGINAYHAGFKVESIFNNSVEDKSYFTNFAKGINCIETVSDYNLMAYKAVFNNNSRGIALDRSHNAKIFFNTFNIGKPAILDESFCEDGTVSAYGIDVENSIGFQIEENQFTKAANTPPGTYTGIAAFSCPSPLDIVYKNTFSNLDYGNYAWGKNRWKDYDDKTGIRYECNYNTGNWTDFCVTGDTAMINGRIAHQLTETVYTASGNSFSATAQWHFRNEGTQDIRYHHFGYGTQYPLPSRVYVLSPGDYFYWISAPENTCASHFGGGSGSGSTDLLMSASERSQTEQQYAQNAADFASVETMFNNLKDGGDTPGTLADIEYAWPDNMWQLVTDLLTKSPYLSEEVLIEVAGRTDVVPQSALFDILAANPDELKKSSLMTFLKEMENPLPDYMIALLEQIAANTTPKTALLNQMELYHSQMTTAAQRLISNELLDSITDYNYVRTWLRKFNTADFDQQVALSFLNEGKTDSAYAVLDTIALKYNLQEADLAEFNQFRSLLELQVQVKAAGRTVFDLDSTELSLVQNAAGGTGIAASYARNILEMGYNGQYCNCVSTNTILNPKRGSVNGFNEKLPELNISASPNPATTWVAFDYVLPEGVRSATLTVTDSQGKAVESFDVTGRQGQKLWDTRRTGSGIYFYTLRAAQLSKSGKFVVR